MDVEKRDASSLPPEGFQSQHRIGDLSSYAVSQQSASREELYRQRLSLFLENRESRSIRPFLQELIDDPVLSLELKRKIVDQTEVHGASLVHHALRYSFSKSVLNALIELGADFDRPVAEGSSGPFDHLSGYRPVHLAARFVDYRKLRLVLKICAEPNSVNNDEENAFRILGRYRVREENVRPHVGALLSAGVSPSLPDQYGISALTDALESKSFSLARVLIASEVRNKSTDLTRPQIAALVANTLAESSPSDIRRDLSSLYSKAPEGDEKVRGLSSVWRSSLARYIARDEEGDPTGKRVLKFVETLRAHIPSLSHAFLKSLLEQPINGEPIIFYLMNRPNFELEIVKSGVKLGVPIHVEATRLQSGEAVRFLQLAAPIEKDRALQQSPQLRTTPIHFAVELGDPDLVEFLIEAGLKCEAKDSRERTPLEHFLRYSEYDEPDIIDVLVDNGAGFSGTANFVKLALKAGLPLSLARLTERGAPLPRAFQGRVYEVPEKGSIRFAGFREVATRVAELLERLDTKVEQERYLHDTVYNSLQEKVELRLVLLTLESYFAGTHDLNKSTPLAFLSLVPHLFGPELSPLRQGLVSAIDLYADSDESIHYEAHPYGSELLALLSDPSLTDQDFEVFALAITSPYRWHIRGRPKVTREELFVWQQVGIETFSFKRWRYDVQGLRFPRAEGGVYIEAPSLLEDFGFERTAPSEAEDVFGAGFSLEPGRVRGRFVDYLSDTAVRISVDSELQTLYRRGMRAVRLPELGTLVIRNSSPVFGRNLLKYPAYFCEEGAGHDAPLEHLTAQVIEERFRPIFDVHIFDDGRAESLNILLRQLRGLEELYSEWKFATRRHNAWDYETDPEKPLFIGGAYSSGFQSIVDFLSRRTRECEKLGSDYLGGVPDLAFVSPACIPFTEHLRLRVTPEVIAVLQHYADTKGINADRSPAHRAAWEFFNTGIRQQSDLLLLHRNEKEDRT
ncbi:MAG: hypothetical protein KDD64_01700 [Bdellovibrionales bacterium]|nr:hypothetical protein [Bdellovibrionales bacterium]